MNGAPHTPRAQHTARLHLPPEAPCPCGAVQQGRPARYGRCCARFIEGGEAAPSALELMRSRYTAYTLHAFDYLRQTWDPSTCPPDLGCDAGTPTHWLGLTVKQHVIDDDAHSRVEFIARYRSAGAGGGRAQRLHELSRFCRGDDGRWRYVDGDMLD